MTDDKPAEVYSADEVDEVRAAIRAALVVVDRMIAQRRRVVYGDSGPGWSPSD
jgi:hypothetical protein